MGLQALYEERGNPFDLAGGCALDGVAIPCSEAMQRLQSGIAGQLIPVNYYVTATLNGQTVFSGYVGTGYANPGDMLMSQTTTHGSLTPQQTQQYGSQLGNQSFWAGMLNGGIDFNTTYANTMYSDDVGTHDLSSAYNVNIFGGAAMIGQSPQNTSLSAYLTNRVRQELAESDCAKFAQTILNPVGSRKGQKSRGCL
jgi:hypothetical protein